MKLKISKLLWLAASCYLLVAAAHGQGACSPDKIALKDTGRPAGGASIKVCAAGGTFPGCASSLFTDPTLGVGAPNPVTADALGNWGFCAAAGVNYDYQITCSGCTTLTVHNFPLPPTTPIAAASLTSSSANPANVGVVKLATGDCIDWRNFANTGNIQLCKLGAASGNLPADAFDMTAAATRSQAFIDNSANPAATGVVRVGNNVCAVAARNAANSADVCAVKVNASDVTLIGGSVPDTGTGTTNKLPKFTTGASGIIGDSSITDNGTIVTFGEPLSSPTLTSPVLSSPQITGALVAGSGYATASVTTCNTGPGVGAACNNTITWSATLSSSTYRMLCELDSPNTAGGIGNSGSKTTTGATISTVDFTAGTAVSTGTVRCIALP